MKVAQCAGRFRRCIVKEHVRHLVKCRAGAVDAVELRTRASEAADRDPPSLLDVRLRIAERPVEIEEPMMSHRRTIIPKPKAGHAEHIRPSAARRRKHAFPRTQKTPSVRSILRLRLRRALDCQQKSRNC